MQEVKHSDRSGFFVVISKLILQELSWYLVWQCVWASKNSLFEDKRLRAIKSDTCVKAVKTVVVTTGGL